MIEAKSEEVAIGMEVFYSSTTGMGGRLKKTPADFIVEEISSYPPAAVSGEYTIVRIRATNWETNRLIRQIARSLHISRKKISFAGSKDKRAVTTQLISIHDDIEKVRNLSINDVEILDTFTAVRGIELGELIGNKFDITLRDIRTPKNEAALITEELKQLFIGLGGFPNFFGVQRFGAVRPNTHYIGKAIIHRKFRDAVMLYAASPGENEDPQATEARKNLERTGDYIAALKEFPNGFSFEKAILNHLATHPDDYVGALRTLPKNLQMLFVHAYQSYLFNRILCERIRRNLPLNTPIEGDIVLPASEHNLPDNSTQIPVTAQNIEKVSEKVSSGKAFVSGLVFGSESGFAGGEQGEIERKIIADERLSGKEFIIPEIKEISSKGTRRELLAPLESIEYRFIDETAINFRFTLNRGCYATSLLREFMKGSLMDY